MCNWLRVVVLGFCFWLVACGGGNDDLSSAASQPDSQRATIQAVKTIDQLEKTKTGFYYPIGTKKHDPKKGWWLSKDPDYLSGKYHLGVDMMHGYGEPVYAIGKGKLWFISDSGWDLPEVQNPKNCAVAVKHELHDGNKFTALYGHLLCETLVFKVSGVDIKAGDVIGYIGDWGNADHLHFGVVPSGESWSDGSTLGMRPVSHWVSNCAKVKDCSNGFTDPFHFIETEWAHDRPQEVQVECQGDICWSPRGSSCETATSRYRLISTSSPFRGALVGSEACTEFREKMQYITTAPNPQERVPDGPLWQRWFRKALKALGLGETASAAEAQALTGYANLITLQVQTGDVTIPWSVEQEAIGRGLVRFPVEIPVPSLPDFITPSVKLLDSSGTERYSYLQTETVRIHSITKNIGDADWAGDRDDMYIKAYLSHGYKEDSHSEWKRVGTAQIQKGNIRVGDEKDEYFTVNLATLNGGLALAPGIWNFVVCSDRKEDNDNGDGEVPEKHKSNNCSTEAVIEVTVDPSYVAPQPDLTVHSLALLQTPTYGGDLIRIGGSIRNNGTIRPPSNIRSSYLFSCNGQPATMLADDGTEPDKLNPGASEWEETLEAVRLPNVSGNCTIAMVADYLGQVSESNENNNTESIPLTLLPRPVPQLAITSFKDDRGCCTTNTGDSIYPVIVVRNNGSAAPATNVTVIYQIHSPIGTGGVYQNIGYGTIEPRELPPGTSDEDYLDAGRWQIPKTSAWKNQWHGVRACLRTDGSFPTGDPNQGDICATYTRFSKK